MSDLHFTHRSGSDRGWLPVWGEERLTSCWEMADMKREMIMSIEHSLNECLLFSPTLIQSVFQYYFPWSPTLLSSLLDWSPYIFLSPLFHHCFLSPHIPLFTFSPPPVQPFLTLAFLPQRSWDTLRQCWQRIRVEFNLDLCFNPRQWNSSLFYKSVKYCLVPWSDRREIWLGILSVKFFNYVSALHHLCYQW